MEFEHIYSVKPEDKTTLMKQRCTMVIVPWYTVVMNQVTVKWYTAVQYQYLPLKYRATVPRYTARLYHGI